MFSLLQLATLCANVYNEKSISGCHVGHLEGTSVYVKTVDGITYVCFRGTDSMLDWAHNVRRFQVPFLMGHCHAGFLDHLNHCWAFLTRLLGSTGHVHFCGHSLGGAVAVLAAARFKYMFNDRVIDYTTFGSPRAVCVRVAKYLDSACPGSRRVFHRWDPVTLVPYFYYHHCGNSVQLTGFSHGIDTYKQSVQKLIPTHRCTL